ncbi:hypothetical protein JCM9279_000256 [Rhodotorula babjevae]
MSRYAVLPQDAAAPISPMSTALLPQRLRTRLQQNRAVAAILLVTTLLVLVVASPSTRPSSVTAALAASSRASSWRTSRSSGEVVWASTQPGLVQKYLAAPFDNYRATFIHAVVQRENDTYRREAAECDRYVAVPVHFEKMPWRNPAHQIKSTWTDFVSHIECTHTFLGKVYEVRAFESYVVWVSFFGCPLPRELDAALDANPRKPLVTTVKWVYKEDKGSFSKKFTLKANYPELESEFGICLSPIWGHLDARATLEWRENLRTLGVETVHWHARNGVVGDFIERYNDATGAKDTFMYAPPVSLETYGHRNNLADAGLYGDQIIYYLSCKFRSLHTNPSRWLAHMDRDEDFLPKVYPPASLPGPQAAARLAQLLPDHFASLPSDIGSACFGKGYHSGLMNLKDEVPPEVAETQPLELAWIHELSPPGASVKCMHRVKGYEVASVHYGDQWYPGHRSEIFENGTEFMSDKVPFRLVHQKLKGGRPPAEPYDPPYSVPDLRAYLGRLWRLREATWSKMRWGCSELPCRFADE